MKCLARIFGSLLYGTDVTPFANTLSTFKAQKLCTRPDLKETEQLLIPNQMEKNYTASSAFTSPLLAYERIPCKLHRKAHLENSDVYKIRSWY